MAETKRPSLTQVKHDIFERDYWIETLVPTLPFNQAIQLLVLNKQLSTHPLDAKTNGLKYWWRVFLDHHWQSFISNNVLAKFTRFYKWDEVTVLTIVDKLRDKIREWDQTYRGRFLSAFYIPTKFLLNRDTELIFVYAEIAKIIEHQASQLTLRIIRFHFQDDNIRFEMVLNDDTTIVTERLFHLLRRTDIERGEIEIYQSPTTLPFLQSILRNNDLSRTFSFSLMRLPLEFGMNVPVINRQGVFSFDIGLGLVPRMHKRARSLRWVVGLGYTPWRIFIQRKWFD
jgi:hypothetical protein